MTRIIFLYSPASVRRSATVRTTAERLKPTVRPIPRSTSSVRFRGFAQDDDGFSQCRRFFLNATGIGEHEIRTLEQIEEHRVIQRFSKRDVLHAAKQSMDRFGNIRIGMHRINELDLIPEAGRELTQRQANAFQWLSEILAPVRRHQDEPGGVFRLHSAGQAAAIRQTADRRPTLERQLPCCR